jgi:hypothetical protein
MIKDPSSDLEALEVLLALVINLVLVRLQELAVRAPLLFLAAVLVLLGLGARGIRALQPLKEEEGGGEELGRVRHHLTLIRHLHQVAQAQHAHLEGGESMKG